MSAAAHIMRACQGRWRPHALGACTRVPLRPRACRLTPHSAPWAAAPLYRRRRQPRLVEHAAVRLLPAGAQRHPVVGAAAPPCNLEPLAPMHSLSGSRSGTCTAKIDKTDKAHAVMRAGPSMRLKLVHAAPAVPGRVLHGCMTSFCQGCSAYSQGIARWASPRRVAAARAAAAMQPRNWNNPISLRG